MDAAGEDVAFDGDPTWKVERALHDGTTITIRPVTPDDREALRRAFGETSSQTRYLRFHSAHRELTEQDLTYLTEVDQVSHVALVATLTSPDLKTERGIGIARFVRLEESPDVAEAAITVIDAMQRLGVGTALTRELERAARVRGVRVIRAEVLADNAAMRSILDAVGAQPRRRDDGAGESAYDIELGEQPLARDGAVMMVLRGAAMVMAALRRLAPTDSASGRAAARASSDESEGDDREE